MAMTDYSHEAFVELRAAASALDSGQVMRAAGGALTDHQICRQIERIVPTWSSKRTFFHV